METALAVTPLVLSTYTIIYKIKLAAEVASQNKDQCDFLAGRLSGIDKLLPLVQQQVPEAAEELTRLGHTLRDAHDLVVDCQNWSMRRKFTRAKRFTEVNARIDSHLNIIQLYCQVVDMSRRPDRTTVPLPTTASHSLTVATTARYGQRIRKRDVIKSIARVTIGVLFHKPEYIARGASAFLK